MIPTQLTGSDISFMVTSLGILLVTVTNMLEEVPFWF